jgi:guanosine-3',5'-bis(diphosphate) 3'-pyrophosphohydrolase
MDLTDAIQIACQAHAGQTDKGGEPYILHPLRVMLAMDTDDERVVGVMHDVFEDGPRMLTGNLSMQRLTKEQFEALVALTRNEGETYTDYIGRVGQNRLATRVKLADLEDNLSDARIKNINESQIDRYVKARIRLEGRVT